MKLEELIAALRTLAVHAAEHPDKEMASLASVLVWIAQRAESDQVHTIIDSIRAYEMWEWMQNKYGDGYVEPAGVTYGKRPEYL